MEIPEFVPVMIIEIWIFLIFAVGLHLLTSPTFATPVVSGLALCVLIAVAVVYTIVFLLYKRGVLIEDPKNESLTRAAQLITRTERVDLTLKEIDVLRIAKAVFHFQLAYYIVYLSHVIVIALSTPEDVEPDDDYWLLLFRSSWEGDNPSRYMIILNCVVSLAILTLFIILSYIVYTSFIRPRIQQDEVNKLRVPHSRRLVEFNPAAFWFGAVSISQILQYTIWLYSNQIDETRYVIYAFIPWVSDLVWNGIVAESWLYAMQQHGRNLGRGLNSQPFINNMKLYIARSSTPVFMLLFTLTKALPFVHESFWYVNIFFISGLIISRCIETMRELSELDGQTNPSTPYLPPPLKTYVGVQQPRVFFKRRGVSKRE
tara:strand:- start:22288 stop:23406 length:1119 start_codon:yes stop_codon:yes gene_type:complete